MTTLTTSNDKAPARPRGRLLFAVDATASREPTWAIARDLQAKMFRAAAPIGKLNVQLVYYGGTKCCNSKWVESGEYLAQWMNDIECVAGYTQIGCVLEHAIRETERVPVQAVVFIGDAMEESLDKLSDMASKLGAAKTPLFMFQEGSDPAARKAFQLLALKSGGRYFKFNASRSQAVQQLSDQLNAIARLAVGDTAALMDQRSRS